MKIKLWSKSFNTTSAWAVKSGDINSYIEISLILSRHWIFCFSVEVMNKSFNYRNPFKALLKALESETIGMNKYDMLKERLRDKDMWREL